MIRARSILRLNHMVYTIEGRMAGTDCPCRICIRSTPNWRLRPQRTSRPEMWRDKAFPGDRPRHFGHEGDRRRRGRAGAVDRGGRAASAYLDGRWRRAGSRGPVRLGRRGGAPSDPTQAGVPISAVALANQGETVLAWDKATGRPLSPAMVWQDRRAESICDALSRVRGHASRSAPVSSSTRTSRRPRCVARDNVTTAGVVDHDRHVAGAPLCGAFVTDASTASRSLFSTSTRSPGTTTSSTSSGSARRSASRTRRQRRDRRSTALFGGRRFRSTGLIVDQQAALLAEAAWTPAPPSARSVRARFCSPSSARTPARSSAGLTTSVAWRLRGRHVLLRGRSGLHRGLRRALGHRARAGMPRRRPTRRRRSRLQ